MSSNKNFNSLFKNYFLYLSVFTIEIICVVSYFAWKNKDILINDAIVEKFSLSKEYSEQYEAFITAYRSTVSHYYLMAAIIVFSVLAMAVTIHILMKKWISDFKKLNYYEDITKNSEMIMKNEAKYRSLFENNGTAILVVGDNELISDCNKKFLDLAGYERDEIINKLHWEKVVSLDDLERVKEYDTNRKKHPEKAPKEYVMKLLRKDGSLRHVIVSVIMMEGTEELASMVDITDMIEKDSALKENQDILSQAQEIASMGSWSYFPETGTLKVSDEFLNMLNISGRTELTLKGIREDLKFEQFYREVSIAAKTGSPIDKEITYLDQLNSKSDKTKFFKIKAKAASDYSDKIIGILQDITDRKKIENEINRKNEDMKNLIYVTTHDLQIPLISIEGFSNMLLNSKNSGELGPETKSCLERIIANTKNMSSLFRNFFDISKINAVRNPFELIKTTDLIKQVINENKLLIEKYGSDISIAEEDHIPDIYGDRENIRLLLHHLITNSIIFGGKNIIVGYDVIKGYFVADNGYGIEQNDLGKIFLPGIKLDKDVSTGSGMGLTFCKKVVDLHNGKIFAESGGRGKGTTFYFNLSYELIRD